MIQLHFFVLPQCSCGLVNSIGSVGVLVVVNCRELIAHLVTRVPAMTM